MTPTTTTELLKRDLEFIVETLAEIKQELREINKRQKIFELAQAKGEAAWQLARWALLVLGGSWLVLSFKIFTGEAQVIIP